MRINYFCIYKVSFQGSSNDLSDKDIKDEIKNALFYQKNKINFLEAYRKIDNKLVESIKEVFNKNKDTHDHVDIYILLYFDIAFKRTQSKYSRNLETSLDYQVKMSGKLKGFMIPDAYWRRPPRYGHSEMARYEVTGLHRSNSFMGNSMSKRSMEVMVKPDNPLASVLINEELESVLSKARDNNKDLAL